MSEPIWIETRDALAIHERLLMAHGGISGIRDPGLLESALARPRQQYACASPNMIEMATAYTAGIVKNHPFLDGNKRTGFVVGVLFIESNSYVFTAPEAEAAHAVLELAAGTIDESGFTEFLRDHVKAPKKQPRRRADHG